MKRRIDSRGYEILSQKPVSVPFKGKLKADPLHLRIRNMIISEITRSRPSDEESFEDADDFEIGDDFDFTSPYEQDFDHIPLEEIKKKRRTKKQVSGSQTRVEQAPSVTPPANSPTPPGE